MYGSMSLRRKQINNQLKCGKKQVKAEKTTSKPLKDKGERLLLFSIFVLYVIEINNLPATDFKRAGLNLLIPPRFNPEGLFPFKELHRCETHFQSMTDIK